jgi:hypothetical protein
VCVFVCVHIRFSFGCTGRCGVRFKIRRGIRRGIRHGTWHVVHLHVRLDARTRMRCEGATAALRLRARLMCPVCSFSCKTIGQEQLARGGALGRLSEIAHVRHGRGKLRKGVSGRCVHPGCPAQRAHTCFPKAYKGTFRSTIGHTHARTRTCTPTAFSAMKLGRPYTHVVRAGQANVLDRTRLCVVDCATHVQPTRRDGLYKHMHGLSASHACFESVTCMV